MHLCEFPSDDNGAVRLIGQCFCQLAQEFFYPVDGFVEDDCFFFITYSFECGLPSFFDGKESEVDKLIDRESGSAECSEERTGPGDDFYV